MSLKVIETGRPTIDHILFGKHLNCVLYIVCDFQQNCTTADMLSAVNEACPTRNYSAPVVSPHEIFSAV